MANTKTERERLEAALLTDAPDLVDAVIDALVAAGASEEWDSETIELVLHPLQEFVTSRGFPPVGSAGPNGENLDFWESIGEQG